MKTYSRHDFTREERAARAKVAISTAFESKEQVFLDFVLSHYVRVGVQELDQEKLTTLLRLKYNDSIADAVAHLGKPEDIGPGPAFCRARMGAGGRDVKRAIYAALGDNDRAFEALDRAAVTVPHRVGLLLRDPEMAALRGDSRFDALRKKLGLP